MQRTESSPDEPLEAAATPRHRILVADDNEDAAESLALTLRCLGHEVFTAHDGEEAVALAASVSPDIAFLDLGMPRLSGHDAARQIRSTLSGRGMMLVAVTGWGQEEDRRRSSEAGFDDHLVKPVDLGMLQGVIGRATVPAMRPVAAG